MGFLFQVPKAIYLLYYYVLCTLTHGLPTKFGKARALGVSPRKTLRQFQPKIKNSYFFLFTNELIMYIVRSRAQIKTGGMAEW